MKHTHYEHPATKDATYWYTWLIMLWRSARGRICIEYVSCQNVLVMKRWNMTGIWNNMCYVRYKMNEAKIRHWIHIRNTSKVYIFSSLGRYVICYLYRLIHTCIVLCFVLLRLFWMKKWWNICYFMQVSPGVMELAYKYHATYLSYMTRRPLSLVGDLAAANKRVKQAESAGYAWRKIADGISFENWSAVSNSWRCKVEFSRRLARRRRFIVTFSHPPPFFGALKIVVQFYISNIFIGVVNQITWLVLRCEDQRSRSRWLKGMFFRHSRLKKNGSRNSPWRFGPICWPGTGSSDSFLPERRRARCNWN